MKTRFSVQQKTIIEKIQQFTTNICICANAGTGKTWTIVQMCIILARKMRFLRDDILFLAFNRSIADELKGKGVEWRKHIAGEKLPEGYSVDEDGFVITEGERIATRYLRHIADVANTHSFGLRCLNEAIKATGVRFCRENDNIKNDKYKKIIRNMISPSYDGNKSEVVNVANDLFDLCRINLLKAGDMASMNALIKHHSLKVNDEVIRIVNILMKTAYQYDYNNPVINFTDMLVFPMSMQYHNPSMEIIPKYKLVFIDECQDLSRAQRQLMQYAAREGRFCAVGDPNQAINGFAGANNDSFDKIASIKNTITLPLSVNYRCGKAIIRLAQDLVPSIEAHEGAEEGIVRTINTLKASDFHEGHCEEVVNTETGEITKKYIEGDMVLARCTAPLVSMCIKLIAAGKTAHVLGRDIVSSIKALVKKSEAKTVREFTIWAEKEKESLAEDIAKANECTKEEARMMPSYITFQDKVNCILAFSHRENNLAYILKELNAIFSDERKKGAITFCTAHKSKGLENYRVLILAPERLPMVWKGQQDWEYQQELNLKYVAITRAKHELVWVNIEQNALFGIEFHEE